MKKAGFPNTETLAEFDFIRQSCIDPAMIGQLGTSTWINDTANLVFLRTSGTGKTHLAIALGSNVARRSYRVMFDSATGWITRLRIAHETGALPKIIKLSRVTTYSSLMRLATSPWKATPPVYSSNS
ncbi:hypothetical protein DC090_04510 [Trueperella pyogenes]|nr:hypothetical protein DC090_04510 [Trueperella pyogenes]AWG16473.1 hypothetical protein DDE06_06440 [Trueperella pyogenes]